MSQDISDSAKDDASHEWPINLDLGQLPPVECVIAYGSGVFRQAGYENSPRPMVDLILVVKDGDLKMWHDENMKRNASHYAGFAKLFGSNFVTHIQNWGPGVYFHPHVSLLSDDGGQLNAKYGVVSMTSLLQDLMEWDWLYLAGRMHKPVLLNWYGSDSSLHDTLTAAVLTNRRAALSAALLLSMDSLGDFKNGGHKDVASDNWQSLGCVKLFESIVRLSYDGDVRVGIGEDPRKVQNIVMAQYHHLWRIYKPISVALGIDVDWVQSSGRPVLLDSKTLRFDFSLQAQKKLLMELPPRFQTLDGPEMLRRTLCGVVRRASLQQTAKGVLTSGISRTLRYSLAKIGKRFK